jgi:catechol 2,3-dioxygenase-like lactoylglutathione lyase family enzyme
MIKGLDHVAIAVEDFTAAVEQYTLLLGVPASAASEAPGQRAALFALSNARILLVEADTRLDGVEALGLSVADGEQAVSQLSAAELPGHPGEIGGAKLWALPQDATRALPLRLVARTNAVLPAANSFATNSVDALDHVVIRSAAPDDAVALYNGALGIRLALDRVLGGVRMLFFRTGGVTLELIADASAGAADSFYGLAYRVRDLAAAHARLTAAGFVLTEARVGRKSGTHVFSVRSSTCGVPTLFIRDASRD